VTGIDPLRELAMALSADDVTVAQVVDRLGGRPTDMGANVVVETPALDGVTWASIVRELEGDAPAHVTLGIARPLSERDLEAALGSPRRVEPDHPGEPASLLYELDLPDRPYAVTLIATTAGDGGVQTVILRRDVRLG